MKWKICPRCRKRMCRAGAIRSGPRNGLRNVYVCKHCGYRSMR